MSNQIMTEISVDLDNRDKNTALIRLILAFPVLVFLGSFSNFADEAMGIAGGMNESIDINHIYSGGARLPTDIGMAFFFGRSE